MNILVTGGNGYIGSHLVKLLHDKGFKPIIFDNLINSGLENLNNLKKITTSNIDFIKGDLKKTKDIEKVFKNFDIKAVFHLGGLKSVQDSVTNPFDYYLNNFVGTLNLINVMDQFKVSKLIFSSSATVYGNPKYLPIDEIHSKKAENPYGRTKLQIEEMLSDFASANKNFGIVFLRYFNPIGSHDSGLIGDNPKCLNSNIMPLILDVAFNKKEKLLIFGNDYPTPDGTGIRDYIHIMDLVEGHLDALKFVSGKKGSFAFNLGSEKGYSVLELIDSFKNVTGIKIPFEFTVRRKGDVAECYANSNKALIEFGWKTTRNLDDMIFSAWKFKKFSINL